VKIGVLIPTYNRRETLLRTIRAILDQEYPLTDLTLTVLDDAGSDCSCAVLEPLRAEALARGMTGFTLLRNSANKGIAYNRFRLTKESGPAEALLYLDDDVYVQKDTIAGLVGCLARNPGCALVGPRLVYASDPDRTAHCANFIGRWDGRYSETDPDEEMDCDWLNSSCFLARAAAAAVVTHAELFYTAHEEVDFCLQLKKAGWRVRYCPSVKAVHDLPLSGGSRRGRLYYLYRNKLLLFERNFPPVRRLTASIVTVFLGLPLYFLESIKTNRGVNLKELRLILKAVFDGLIGRGGPLSS